MLAVEKSIQQSDLFGRKAQSAMIAGSTHEEGNDLDCLPLGKAIKDQKDDPHQIYFFWKKVLTTSANVANAFRALLIFPATPPEGRNFA